MSTKKDFSAIYTVVILLTMPIHFLVAFGLVIRGKAPWGKKNRLSSKTKIQENKKPRSKESLFDDTEVSYT